MLIGMVNKPTRYNPAINPDKALSRRNFVIGQMEKAGYFVKNVEGYDAAHWILMDYGDVILHIFDEENRLFYDLERIWRDGKPLDAASLSDSGVEA